MKKDIILKEIFDQNKHWENPKLFFEGQKYTRMLFPDLLRYLPDRQILSLVGLRRTGKTVILKQLIKHLIHNEGVPARSIFFLSFDEALVTTKMTLQEYLEVFLKDVSETYPKERMYIFLDEIQYIPRWQHILKRYYDRERNVKFIISGSSSLFLKKKTTESLAGRIYEFKLDILDFAEFLELSGTETSLVNEYKQYAISVGDTRLSQSAGAYTIFLAQHGDFLRKKFEEYLLYGQFPEIVGQTDTERIRKYITESIYKKTIEYDIPNLFSVEKVDELKFLFQILVNENGSLVEFQRISAEAGIEENTLKKYLSYFQDSFLVDVMYNHSRSFRKSKRLQKKTYVSSTNFFMAFRTDWTQSAPLQSEYIGMLAETYIYNLLKKKYAHLSFYRKGKNEFDFVAGNDYRDFKTHSCIEVKYTNTVRRNEMKFISNVAQSTFHPKYSIYSKEMFESDENRMIIPCFMVR